MPPAVGKDSVAASPTPGPRTVAHLEVDDLGLTVEGAAFERSPGPQLPVRRPTAQPLHGTGQDVLVQLRPPHRLRVHTLFGHLGMHRNNGLCRGPRTSVGRARSPGCWETGEPCRQAQGGQGRGSREPRHGQGEWSHFRRENTETAGSQQASAPARKPGVRLPSLSQGKGPLLSSGLAGQASPEPAGLMWVCPYSHGTI